MIPRWKVCDTEDILVLLQTSTTLSLCAQTVIVALLCVCRLLLCLSAHLHFVLIVTCSPVVSEEQCTAS